MAEEKQEKKLDSTKCSVDPVTVEMLQKAQAEGIETIWDRAEKMKACPIGAEGACCRICSQGPCRVPKPKKAGEDTKGRMGLCGATAETIVARNFARMVCSGAAAHNDHSRGTALLFKEVAHGKAQGYQIKDVAKLKKVAKDWGVAITEGEGDDKKARSAEVIAQEMADKVLLEFGQQAGELPISNAPPRSARKSGGPRAWCPGLRYRNRRTDAPHPHGRGPGISQYHQTMHPHRPVRRLGRFHDLH